MGRLPAEWQPYLDELEAKLKRLESRGFEDLHDENERMKATIKAISELPDKWRDHTFLGKMYKPVITAEQCADELQAILKRSEDDG